VPATLFKPSILLSHYVSGLTPGTVYSFKTEAVDWAGNPSSSGPSITVTTLSNGAPTVPWWIQYWYLFAIAGVAVGSVTAAVVFSRRTRGKGVAERPQASTSIRFLVPHCLAVQRIPWLSVSFVRSGCKLGIDTSSPDILDTYPMARATPRDCTSRPYR
jgi:hypothetical protein